MPVGTVTVPFPMRRSLARSLGSGTWSWDRLTCSQQGPCTDLPEGPKQSRVQMVPGGVRHTFIEYTKNMVSMLPKAIYLHENSSLLNDIIYLSNNYILKIFNWA